MNERMKLHLALMQLNNLSSLLKGNQYESFLYGKLIGIEVELRRQLSLLKLTKTNDSSTIQETKAN